MTFTNQILEFLSGNVPGGIIPYLFLIALLDLVFYVLGKHSDLFDWSRVKRRLQSFTAIAFLAYAMAWYGLKPETLNPRFIVFPTISDSDSEYMAIPLLIEQQYKEDIQKEYFYHPAKWIVKSADRDSLFQKSYQILLAKRMKAELSLISWKESGGYHWELWNGESSKPLFSGSGEKLTSIIYQISQKLNEMLDLSITPKITPQLLPVSRLYWLSKTDSTLKVIDQYENSDSLLQNNLTAEVAYSHAIIRKAYDEKKAQKLISNPFKKNNRYSNWFIKGREKMIQQGMRSPDNPEINLVLADAYILEENFYKAEIALKNAYASDSYDAEVYFLLSFLNPRRYKDLGYKNINQVLDKAIHYDPMFEDAVTRYVEKIGKTGVVADHYYFELTTKICDHFLEIKPSSFGIWNDLAGLYLVGSNFSRALKANDMALKYAPHNEGVLYNAGIIRYRLNKFSEAQPFFDELISRYNHLDSRLYRGMIYRKKEMYKEAVLDFRYRILNKTSDDDTYYKEAVKGIRRIRRDLEKKGINLDDIIPPYKVKR